jgi:hypothetical protein
MSSQIVNETLAVVQTAQGRVLYIGRFENQLPDTGQDPRNMGIVFYPNGDVYHGRVQAGVLAGEGCYFSNDVIMSGNFTNGQLNCRLGEIFYYKQNVRYEGNVQNGKPEGDGSIYWPDGAVLHARFKNGIAHDDNHLCRYTSGDGLVQLHSVFQDNKPHSSTAMLRIHWIPVTCKGTMIHGSFRNGVVRLGMSHTYSWEKVVFAREEDVGKDKPPLLPIPVDPGCATHSSAFLAGFIEALKKPGYSGFWDSVPSNELAFRIPKTDPMYQIIETLFVEGHVSTVAPSRDVLNIYFVNNPDRKKLWDEELQKMLPQWTDTMTPPELAEAVQLGWHGTRGEVQEGELFSDVQMNIMKNGFEPCLAGSATGALYGLGMYNSLFRNANYSTKLAGYATQTGAIECANQTAAQQAYSWSVFLNGVLTGRLEPNEYGQKKLPGPRGNDTETTYDGFCSSPHPDHNGMSVVQKSSRVLSIAIVEYRYLPTEMSNDEHRKRKANPSNPVFTKMMKTGQDKLKEVFDNTFEILGERFAMRQNSQASQQQSNFSIQLLNPGGFSIPGSAEPEQASDSAAAQPVAAAAQPVAAPAQPPAAAANQSASSIMIDLT